MKESFSDSNSCRRIVISFFGLDSVCVEIGAFNNLPGRVVVANGLIQPTGNGL